MNMDKVNLVEKYGLPEGNYTLVAWDMVATGGNLYDDICQLIAYAPDAANFSQHVMPYHNMSIGTRRRHNLNVIQTGRYRVLKDIRTNKTLLTKTIYSTLGDFIEWLKNVKGDSDGVIMVNHDTRHLISAILIEVLTNYNMQEKFCSIVKGFTNCADIAEAKCDKSVKHYSIRFLCTGLLSDEENAAINEANFRPLAIYSVMKHIFKVKPVNDPENKSDDCTNLAEDIRAFCYTIDGVNKMRSDLRALQLREESLHPLFSNMRSTRSERQRSFNLQRLLARSNIDYDILNDIYKKGGMEAMNEVLKCTMAQEHARELDELKHIFALHFNPEYKGEWKPEKPVNDRPRSFRRNSRNGRKPRINTNGRSDPENTDTPTAPLPAVTITNEQNQTQAIAAGV